MADAKSATCTPQPDGTLLCPPVLTVSCVPPLLYTCRAGFSGTTCACERPPEAICRATIEYPGNNPREPVLADVTPGCDGAAIELALAILLAKLLGAP